MLKCKYIQHGLSYEDYLLDVLNASMFFCHKKSFMERYRKPESEAHGECDAVSSNYSIDFKLIVDEAVMKARTENKPSVDTSRLSQGMVFVKTKPDLVDVPPDTLLHDIFHLTRDDIQSQTYQNKAITGIVKNLKKAKHLFLYLPYEYTETRVSPEDLFVQMLSIEFGELMRFREQEQPDYETYICVQVNGFSMESRCFCDC